MGLETECRIVLDGRRLAARVQLETQEIVIRGEQRTVIPFARIRGIEVDGEWLRLRLEGGDAAIELGETQAARWSDRIRNPKRRLDKLGARTGQRVAVVGVDDATFLPELEQRGVRTARARAGAALDLVFLGARSRADLARLAELREAIRPEGAVWVTWPKGRPELREDDVRGQALKVGLVDVKVVSFSDTLSGLKLVIPLISRPKAANRPSASARTAKVSRRMSPASRSDSRKVTRSTRRPATRRAARTSR